MGEQTASLAKPRTPSRPFQRPVSLAEVLDRVLNKGVVVAGEVVITVAGIELVYLGVNLILASTDTARGLTPRAKEYAVAAAR